MSHTPLLRRMLATSVLIAGAIASAATSGPSYPPGGVLEASAESPGLVLDSANRIASGTVTIALNDEAVPPEVHLYGGLFLDASACVGAQEDAPGRLRVSLIPELPVEGSVIEIDVPACPESATFRLGLFTWNSCVEGQPCAERYDVHFESLGPATSPSGMGVTFSASANASGYEDELPPEGAELTVVIE